MKIESKILIGSAGFLALHLILRELRKRRPRLTIVDKLPFNYNALTIPPIGIFIDKEKSSNKELIDHELTHWKQYQTMGLFPFYYRYVDMYLAHGYDLHPMELEARSNESDYCRTNYTECVRTGQSATAFNTNFRKSG